MPTSTELAADRSLVPVWDPAVPFPAFEAMPDLDIVTHVVVERARPGGYHYLHEPSLVRHHGHFQLCFANHRTAEVNTRDELIRGRTSTDALHWREPEVWVEPPQAGCASFNHPVLFSHDDRLLGFFVGWRDERPTTELFELDEATGDPGGTSRPRFPASCLSARRRSWPTATGSSAANCTGTRPRWRSATATTLTSWDTVATAAARGAIPDLPGDGRDRPWRQPPGLLPARSTRRRRRCRRVATAVAPGRR